MGRPLRVKITPEALERVGLGRKWVEQLAQRGDAIYGINTGFGHLKNKRISTNQLDQLQENLIISHAVGVGPIAPPEIARWIMLFKLHMLLQGHSGVRPEVVRAMQTCLNADILPIVPTRGSLGASGDLAPLAHMGTGIARLRRNVRTARNRGKTRESAGGGITGRDRARATASGGQGRIGPD